MPSAVASFFLRCNCNCVFSPQILFSATKALDFLSKFGKSVQQQSYTFFSTFFSIELLSLAAAATSFTLATIATTSTRRWSPVILHRDSSRMVREEHGRVEKTKARKEKNNEQERAKQKREISFRTAQICFLKWSCVPPGCRIGYHRRRFVAVHGISLLEREEGRRGGEEGFVCGLRRRPGQEERREERRRRWKLRGWKKSLNGPDVFFQSEEVGSTDSSLFAA